MSESTKFQNSDKQSRQVSHKLLTQKSQTGQAQKIKRPKEFEHNLVRNREQARFNTQVQGTGEISQTINGV